MQHSIVHEDWQGELLIADANNNKIRKVDKNGVISTVAKDLSYPAAVSVGRYGGLFIVENGKHRITRVDLNGLYTTTAGTYRAGPPISDFNLPENARLVLVSSVSVLSDTELIVADTYNHMIKKVNMTTKTIVSLGYLRPSLSYPRGTIIVNNVIYFADYGNHCIRQMDLNGVITDVVGVCGTGGYSVDGTPVNAAKLFYPSRE